MPALKHRLPKYRLHKRSGQAIVTLNGRDFYLGKHGSAASKRQYEQLTGEWQANGRLLPKSNCETITITELCISYIQHCKNHYLKNGKLTSEFDNAKRVIKFFRSKYGKLAAEDFGPVKFKAFRQLYMDRGLVRESVNHKTQHHNHERVVHIGPEGQRGGARRINPELIFYRMPRLLSSARGLTNRVRDLTNP